MAYRSFSGARIFRGERDACRWGQSEIWGSQQWGGSMGTRMFVSSRKDSEDGKKGKCSERRKTGIMRWRKSVGKGNIDWRCTAKIACRCCCCCWCCLGSHWISEGRQRKLKNGCEHLCLFNILIKCFIYLLSDVGEKKSLQCSCGVIYSTFYSSLDSSPIWIELAPLLLPRLPDIS